MRLGERAARRFSDRTEAGRLLAAELARFRGREDVVVLGLPRGGVPVAFEVATALTAPLDVFVVRKLGVPGHEELAFGAIASGGARVLNEEVVEGAGIAESIIASVTAAQEEELRRRELAYRGNRAPLDVTGRTVILVDDGIATGATVRAAVQALRQRGAARVVVAVPVAAPTSCARLGPEVDDLVCLRQPDPFYAVGLWYDDFSETSDDEVRELLERDGGRAGETEARADEVCVGAGNVDVGGTLTVPDGARGIVLFAHGSGSSRFSPRNRFVARVLHGSRLATLLVDLLTPGEEEVDQGTREHRFDIRLLADRLVGATDWIAARPELRRLPVGYFGASTGAAAALVAAAERADVTRAVVSRGGRPDLAGAALSRVRAPTLLIVGERDPVVLDLTREAMAELRAEHALEVVPRATHLFEEPGALEEVARLARAWFERHLPRDR